MAQDFLRSARSDLRRNTLCIARKADKGEHKKDKSDSAFQFPRRSVETNGDSAICRLRFSFADNTAENEQPPPTEGRCYNE